MSGTADYSYSYSGPYSDSGYSYSGYSDEYSSYSSTNDSRTATAPVNTAVEHRPNGDSGAFVDKLNAPKGSVLVPSYNSELVVPSPTDVAGRKVANSSSYSYSYSYSDTEASPAAPSVRPPPPQSPQLTNGNSTYSYSSYNTMSAETGTPLGASESYSYTPGSYSSYQASCSYTENAEGEVTGYSYSGSTAHNAIERQSTAAPGGGEEQRSTSATPEYSSYSYSYSYPFSSSYYTYDEEYSSSPPPATGFVQNGSGATESYSQSSSSERIDKAMASPTTSSVTYTSESFSTSTTPSSRDRSQPVPRDLVALRVPSSPLPPLPPVPKRCFISARSVDDVVHALLEELGLVQSTYEAQRRLASVTLTAVEDSRGGSKKKEKKSSSEAQGTLSPVTLTPMGYFSKRSARMGLRAIGLTHLERSEALKNVALPIPSSSLEMLLYNHATARVKEKMAQSLIHQDTYRCGELALTRVVDIFRQFGIAASPTIEGTTINIGLSEGKKPELVMMVADAGGDNTAVADGTTAVNTNPVFVCRIVHESMLVKAPTSIRWSSGTIYMGRHVICRNIREEESFQRLKSYIEAATYACVVTQLHTIMDKSGPVVLYPHVVRALLTASVRELEGEHGRPRKLLYLENLIRSIYKPVENLLSYSKLEIVTDYRSKEVVESVLDCTQNTEEKRRRNVVPIPAPDGLSFVSSPRETDSHTGRTSATFTLEKVRVPDAVPSDASCFCLVSAVTAENSFLPAVAVLVRSIRASSKGGYTWTFFDKRHPRSEGVIFYSGPGTLRLYVECCYTIPGTEDGSTGGSQSHETVWCAGYAITDRIGELESATLPVKDGSLYDTEEGPRSSLQEVPGKKKGGLLACLPSRKKVNVGHSATAVKLGVHKVKIKEQPPLEDMPRTYLLLQRHLELTALLRRAIAAVGRQSRHVAQTLRHQHVRRVFLLASDATLLDQLQTLWTHQTKQWNKSQKGDKQFQYQQLLHCCAALAALYNCSSEDKHCFAEILLKKKPMAHALGEMAPQVPVCV